MTIKTSLIWFACLFAYVNHVPPAENWWLIFGVAAAWPLLALFSRKDEDVVAAEKPAAIALFGVGGALGLAWWGIPGFLPVALCWAVALVGGYAPRGVRLLNALGRGARVAGEAGALAGLAYLLFWHLEPYFQGTPIPLVFAEGLAGLFGVDLSIVGGTMTTTLENEVRNFHLAPRGTAVFPALLFLSLASMELRRRAGGWKFAIGAILIVLAYRDLMVIGVALRASELDAAFPLRRFWLWYAIAWLPLALALSVLARFVGGRAANPTAPTWNRRRVKRHVGFAMGIALVAFAFVWRDPGVAKAGRIAIDDSHSDWEWMDVPLDRNVFGPKTTYNYWSMGVLLSQYFNGVEVHDGAAITPERLREFDVWILKTPTKPYTEAEVKAIRDYVDDGGGIWLIGDHTNVFGMNSHLNQVARHYGVTYRSDALVPLPGSGTKRQFWRRPRLDHEVVEGFDNFLWATSCSLIADFWNTSEVLVGDQLFADLADYHPNTFFGDLRLQSGEETGRFLQCVGIRSGKGRVLAFSDSTIFSSFFVQVSGKRELALGSIHWLNHRNRSDAWRWILGLVGIALAGWAGLVRSGLFDHRVLPHWVAVGIMVGVAFAGSADRALRDSWPEPTWTLPRIGVHISSPTALPVAKSIPHEESSADSFQTFFVWLQRVPALPFVMEDLNELPDPRKDNLKGMVFIEPRAVSDDEINRIEEYVREGGNVWILSDRPETLRRWQRVLDLGTQASIVPLGQGFEPGRAEVLLAACREDCDHDHEHHGAGMGPGFALPRSRSCLEGGRSLLSAKGRTFVADYPLGAGRVCFSSSATAFSNKFWGGVTQIPTRDRYHAYEMVWNLVEEWCGHESSGDDEKGG